MTHLAKLSPEYCSGDDDDVLASRHTCRFTLEKDRHLHKITDQSKAVCHVRPPGYRPVAAGDPPVGELVLHEEDVGLQDVDVVEVVADGARQRRLPDLLQLRERQRAAGVRVLAVLVPKPVKRGRRGCNKVLPQFILNRLSLHCLRSSNSSMGLLHKTKETR